MFAIRHDDHSLEIEFIANLQSSVDRAKDIHIQVDMNQSIFPGCLQVFDNRDAGHPHDSCNFSLAFAFLIVQPCCMKYGIIIEQAAVCLISIHFCIPVLNRGNAHLNPVYPES